MKTKYRNFNLPTDTYAGKKAYYFFYCLGLGLVFIFAIMLTILLISYNKVPKGQTPKRHVKHICDRPMDILVMMH